MACVWCLLLSNSRILGEPVVCIPIPSLGGLPLVAHPPPQDRADQTQVDLRMLNVNTKFFLQDLQGTRSSGRLWQRDRQHPERRSARCLLLLPGAAHLVRPLLQLPREAAAGSLRRAVSRGTKRGPCPCLFLVLVCNPT